MQTDPIGQGGGNNLYGYAAGRPATLVDSSGTIPSSCGENGINCLGDEVGGPRPPPPPPRPYFDLPILCMIAPSLCTPRPAPSPAPGDDQDCSDKPSGPPQPSPEPAPRPSPTPIRVPGVDCRGEFERAIRTRLKADDTLTCFNEALRAYHACKKMWNQ